MWNRKTKESHSELGLDRKTEAELAYKVIEEQDGAARNRLVESHLALVKRMASNFARRGANFEDLVQEGSLALIRAAETFEPDRKVRFATYAAYWIRSHMQRYLAALRSQQYAAPASVAYLGGRSRGKNGDRRLLHTVSLDAPASHETERPLVESLNSDTETPDQAVERTESKDLVHKALKRAFEELHDERAAVVIEKRILSDDPATLAEIGKELHLSREGARLLELRLLNRMRSLVTERAA